MTTVNEFGSGKKQKKSRIYQCRRCSFETRNEEAFNEHVSSVHVMKNRIGTPILDRFGVPVREQIVAPMIKES